MTRLCRTPSSPPCRRSQVRLTRRDRTMVLPGFRIRSRLRLMCQGRIMVLLGVVGRSRSRLRLMCRDRIMVLRGLVVHRSRLGSMCRRPMVVLLGLECRIQSCIGLMCLGRIMVLRRLMGCRSRSPIGRAPFLGFVRTRRAAFESRRSAGVSSRCSRTASPGRRSPMIESSRHRTHCSRSAVTVGAARVM